MDILIKLGKIRQVRQDAGTWELSMILVAWTLQDHARILCKDFLVISLSVILGVGNETMYQENKTTQNPHIEHQIMKTDSVLWLQTMWLTVKCYPPLITYVRPVWLPAWNCIKNGHCQGVDRQHYMAWWVDLAWWITHCPGLLQNSFLPTLPSKTEKPSLTWSCTPLATDCTLKWLAM